MTTLCVVNLYLIFKTNFITKCINNFKLCKLWHFYPRFPEFSKHKTRLFCTFLTLFLLYLVSVTKFKGMGWSFVLKRSLQLLLEAIIRKLMYKSSFENFKFGRITVRLQYGYSKESNLK